MKPMQTGKRGRPAYAPTPQIREQVELFLACGMTHDQISAALAIDSATFKKHFTSEIETGRGRARARILGMLVTSAQGGNVSAQKRLEEMSRLATPAPSFEAAQDQERAPAKGKKEAAQEKARETVATPSSDWGDDLNPNALN